MNLTAFKYICKNTWFLIICLALLKLLVHLLTYDNFELHRDAYLYYAQSEHLAWGYVAVPPGIAFVGKMATLLFGNSPFGLRFLPALVGSLNVLIIGMAVREMGGKRIAIVLACLAYLLSPSYLHVNALFQPVSFNHFFWLLTCYLALKMIHRDNPRIWLWIGLTFGLGFLNKYAIVFLYAALAPALLLTRYRYLYASRYFWMAMVIGWVIISPNLFWQYQNNWPVLHHMAELRETQLVHVKLTDFIRDQFLMNMQAVFIWMGAIAGLVFLKKEKAFRLFGYTYLFVIVLLMLGSGKSYYTLGIYPILFILGAVFMEKYIPKYRTIVAGVLIGFMMVSLYVSLAFDGIPLTTFEKAERPGAFRWEDGVYHDLPQDMADMTGWREIGETVSALYATLSPEAQADCDIFCYHYGQAGAVMFYGKEAKVPQPISFNSSFVFWAPDSITSQKMIWVHSDLGNDIDPDQLLPEFFEQVALHHTIENPWFRENGTRIYLCEFPTDSCKVFYRNRIKVLKDNYRD